MADPLREFLDVMRELRRGCPWKAEQTHRSLVRYLLEETHETVEAIETGTPADLREELGDLLLQVYFHAVIAEESGEFTIDDVAGDVTAKMHRRNPHVFGDAAGGTAAEVDAAWQRIKADEKRRTSAHDGLPASLPALLWADKLVGRGAVGIPGYPGVPALVEACMPQQVQEGSDKSGEADPAEGYGDALLALVAEAHAAGVDSEQALRDAVRRHSAPQDGPAEEPHGEHGDPGDH